MVAICALATGLAIAPLAGVRAPGRLALVVLAAASAALVAGRPSRCTLTRRTLWATGLGLVCLALGLAVGGARLSAIDAGAATVDPQRRVLVRGFVEAVPRRTNGEARVRVETAAGRLLLVAPEPVGELAVGHEVEARGTVTEPRAWEETYLERLGIARTVRTSAIEPTGRRRGGLASLTDRLRERAEAALDRGTPQAESALLRGFVLGEDDRIDPATVADFQESGLAHLLAVSGQNVLLLALLAMALLGLLGVPLRLRLICILALITLYVPIAGAGPSIQRAGVMGAAGVVAALASRPSARWYALSLAASATLALNPRVAGDVGWQLSFAAVAGIALWARPLRGLLAGGNPSRARQAVAEAAAVTIAATLATAPLMAHHFEALSLAALPANLIALPAVAPVMWLGMLAAAVGQLPWLPVGPLTGLAGLCAAFVAQVAHWFAGPGWAQLDAPLSSGWALAAIYALMVSGIALLRRVVAARRRLRVRRAILICGILAAAAAVLVVAVAPSPPSSPQPPLRVTVLDVGQGDAILLEPRGADPILVDTGPPASGIVEHLADHGVERLAALVITHEDSDHAGEVHDVLSRVESKALAYGAPAPMLERAATATGTRTVRLAEGSELSSGPLTLGVLWPPRPLIAGTRPEEPNLRSLVMLASWRDFDLLLQGDAEAEAVPIEPGPVDVLKVAHHGSDDEGLDSLLDRTAAEAAVISVGAENTYGHPTAKTLASLAEHGVPALRTDTAGELEIEVSATGWTVGPSE